MNNPASPPPPPQSKIKTSGKHIISIAQIKARYDHSYLPQPFRSLYCLNGCWNINKRILRDSAIFAFPFTLIYALFTDVAKSIHATNWRLWPWR